MQLENIIQGLEVNCPINGRKVLEPGFAIKRVSENIKENFSECNFQRQTGRTTKLALVATCLLLRENAKVQIYVRTQDSCNRIKSMIIDFLNQLGHKPNTDKSNLISLGKNNTIEFKICKTLKKISALDKNVLTLVDNELYDIAA